MLEFRIWSCGFRVERNVVTNVTRLLVGFDYLGGPGIRRSALSISHWA